MIIIQGLDDYTKAEVKQMIIDFIKNKIDENDIDAKIIKLELHGSRLRGTAHETSDLDAVFQFSGEIREDDLFNTLNDPPFYIENIKVDINPIKEDLNEYMKRSKEYDRTILNL